MKDRQPTKPGRVLITPEGGGAAYYAVVTMADEPTETGTPPTKEYLLPDTVRDAIGLTGDASVADALSALDSEIGDRSFVFLKRGTLATDAATIFVDLSNLDFTPYQAIRLVVNPISAAVNPMPMSFTMNNISSVDNAYIYSISVNGTFSGTRSLSAHDATTSGGTVITVDISLTHQLPGTITCRGDYTGAGFTFFYVDPAYLSKSNLVNLQIHAIVPYLFKAGSQYVLYGIKG